MLPILFVLTKVFVEVNPHTPPPPLQKKKFANLTRQAQIKLESSEDPKLLPSYLGLPYH